MNTTQMCNNQLAMKVMLLIGSMTWDEFWTALPKAHAKLFRIIEREGKSGGKRLAIEYTAQLIAEQIEQDRISNSTQKDVIIV